MTELKLLVNLQEETFNHSVRMCEEGLQQFWDVPGNTFWIKASHDDEPESVLVFLGAANRVVVPEKMIALSVFKDFWQWLEPMGAEKPFYLTLWLDDGTQIKRNVTTPRPLDPSS